MTDISPKIKFYMRLWKDYKDHKESGMLERAYIYRYMKNRKDAKAKTDYTENCKKYKNAARPDMYIYIQSLFLCFQSGEISKRTLISTLRKLINEKTNLRPFSDRLNDRTDDKDLEKLISVLSDACLRKDIQVFFNDIGYVEKIGKNEPPKERSAKNAPSDKNRTREGHQTKQNEILDLYFGFESEKTLGISLLTENPGSATDRAADAQYLEDCEKLFADLLNNENARKAFIPLAFDEITGAGVFIIGSKNLGIPTLEAKRVDDPNVIVGKDVHRKFFRSPTCACYLAYFESLQGGSYSGRDNDIDDEDDIDAPALSGFFDFSFQILESASDLSTIMKSYRDLKLTGKYYECYPQTNINMTIFGESHPRFAEFLIDRSEESEGTEHERDKAALVNAREDQLHHAQLMK